MKSSKIRSRILGLVVALILCFGISASATGPSVSFTRFLAGGNEDQAKAVAMDSAGNTYVAGFTYSNNFPLVFASISSFQAPSDAFLTKLSPSGAVLFSTYWGGSGSDIATGIAVDSTGVYITGYTNSPNFPGHLIGPLNSQYHIFVSKFSLSGQQIYSVVFGGSSLDEANAIAVDSSHNVYVAGMTHSTDLPMHGASVNHGGYDAFVAKLDSLGNLINSAYVGGSNSDWANGVAVDGAGYVYITGLTASVNFPHTMPITIGAGTNTFVVKLNPGLGMMFSNVQGGGNDWGIAIWADTFHTYVTGLVSPNSYFPTSVGAFQTQKPSSGFAAFVAEFDSTYGERIYSSYLGGNDKDTRPTAIAVQGGNVYVAGNTSSTSFPGAPAITPNPTAGWVVKLAPQLNSLFYTTFLGASINGIAVDLRYQRLPSTISNVEVYTAGYRFTGSTAISSEDAFAVKLVEPASSPVICCAVLQ